MNIVAHHHRSSELLSSKISHFLEEFHVSKILSSCNAYKVRGFSGRIVKLSATPLKNRLHMVFCNQGTS